MSRYNDILLSPIIMLTSLGLIMVFSAGSNPFSDNMSGLSLFIKQFMWVILGTVLLLICSHMNYRKLIDLSKVLLVMSVIIGILAYFTKPDSEPTARSLYLFGRSIFQTSEIIKIALIIFTASFINNYKRKIIDFNFMIKNYYPYFCISIMVVLFQTDFSSAMVISGIVLGMLFVAGISVRQMKVLFMIGLSALLVKFFFIPSVSGNMNYQDKRLDGFFDGGDSQQNNAIDEIATSNFLPRIGASNRKVDYIAQAHTDFIYTITASELGLLGVLTVFGGFLMILIRGINIVKQSKDLFGMFLAIGITFNLIFYFMVHVGYNIGLFPTTGLPLPFVSYGGSHMLMNFTQIGLLLSIAYKIKNGK